MIIESISIKPKAISTFMTLENLLEVKVKDQGQFMGLIRLEKASNVARDLCFLLRLFTQSPKLKAYKNILVKTVCSIYAQQYSRK